MFPVTSVWSSVIPNNHFDKNTSLNRPTKTRKMAMILESFKDGPVMDKTRMKIIHMCAYCPYHISCNGALSSPPWYTPSQALPGT